MRKLTEIELDKISIAFANADFDIKAKDVSDLIAAMATQPWRTRNKIIEALNDMPIKPVAKQASVQVPLAIPGSQEVIALARKYCPGCDGPDIDCTPENCDAMSRALEKIRGKGAGNAVSRTDDDI